MRQVLSTALVALIVSALTVTVAGALAQEPAPAPSQDVVTAGLNADSVDGKHAVSSTGKKSVRRNKLVAADSKGYLPSNIVKPKWGLISEKPAAFADGVIGWGEVQGIPAGFADAVDDGGVTGLRYTVVTSSTPTRIDPGGTGSDLADCPTGYLAVGGGYVGAIPINVYASSASDPDTWRVTGHVPSSWALPYYLYAQVTCLRVEPDGLVATSKNSSFAPAKRKGRQP